MNFHLYFQALFSAALKYFTALVPVRDERTTRNECNDLFNRLKY